MNKWTALAVCAVATASFPLAGCGGGSSSPKVEHVPVTTAYKVPSSAMEPTLHCALPGPDCKAAIADEVVAESLSSDPERGDILVFRAPTAAEAKCGPGFRIPGGIAFKRVIALPRETWEERDGVVFINGQRLVEPYVKGGRRDHGTYPPRKIPEGGYFFMGDNRAHSCDSREWGAVPRENVIGKVVTIRRPG